VHFKGRLTLPEIEDCSVYTYRQHYYGCVAQYIYPVSSYYSGEQRGERKKKGKKKKRKAEIRMLSQM